MVAHYGGTQEQTIVLKIQGNHRFAKPDTTTTYGQLGQAPEKGKCWTAVTVGLLAFSGDVWRIAGSPGGFCCGLQ